jgi:hypothetical protein
MVDVHSGKLTSAIKIRIDDRMRNVNSDSMATNDLIDRVTTEMATRISDDLFARQNGELVPIGRRVPDIGQERQPPVKINRPNF